MAASPAFGCRDPHVAIHGSLSLMVNFHALAEVARSYGASGEWQWEKRRNLTAGRILCLNKYYIGQPAPVASGT